ncbi:rab5 GDP/GTP exchange factor-like isoform X2 [Spea bombifrons]|uniref:rab5 GDP/GTP exchange factor-like isoform X2 n=1 Tax=Spea bombifrons TaxID=233779 RepID=UPI002349D1E8|nr:rab5 GDP/GTP exchange factor-like isoform X2 [Spea bombifrons]
MNPGASNEELFSHLNETPFNFKGFAYHPEMCRKGCGYYGNPIWHGYCSSCWIMQRQKSQARPLTDGFRHHTGTLLIKPDKGRTEEKSEKLDTTRDICCSTKTNNRHYPQTICKTLLPTDIPDYLYCLSLSSLRTLAQGDFSDFLKALQRPDAQPLMTLCTKFIQWLQKAEDLSLESKGDRVQEFYCRIADRYPDQLTEERDQLLSNIEKLVMTQLYKSVFCLDGSLDEQKDISLQKRIRSLKWVTPQMLQLPMDEDNLEVKDWIFSAITALVELDSKRAPQDKLACLSRASNFLFKAIRAYKEEPATTDDFLSCLVYTILKANPPRLSSNLQYITKFCNPKKLVIGEEGYCFTNTTQVGLEVSLHDGMGKKKWKLG